MSGSPLSVLPIHTRFTPVFVLGHARSGTSLMCRLLLDHLGVNFGTESQFIVRYRHKSASYGDLHDDRRLRWLLEDISRERFFARTRQNFGFVLDLDRAAQTAQPRTYAGVLRAIFDQFAASQGRSRWGDKTPEYCRHLPVIHELFPDAQFVHVVRDGRDVAHSVFQTGFGAKNAYEAARDWSRTLADVSAFGETLAPNAFIQVKYEALLKNPAVVMGEIASFLGIENHAAVMAVAAPALRAQVRESNSLKWKEHLTWREIECFEAFAGEELTALDYPLQFRPRIGRPNLAEPLFWRAQAIGRRLSNWRYWRDNLYKIQLRFRDIAIMLRALARVRHGNRLSLAGAPSLSGDRSIAASRHVDLQRPRIRD